MTVKALILDRYGTESEFARHLGWTRQQLNRYTTSKRLPGLLQLEQMSSGLGIPLGDLALLFLDQWSQNWQPKEN